MNVQNHTAPDCPCTSDCPRHGDCAACVDHHRSGGSLPFCVREVTRIKK